MVKSKVNLVDEGFRVSLVETAFFDGKFEIPHIDGPDKIIIPEGMVPFSVRERSQDKKDFVCFYENDINFREILTDTEDYVDELEPEVVLVYGSMPEKIFGGLENRAKYIQYSDWMTRKKQMI